MFYYVSYHLQHFLLTLNLELIDSRNWNPFLIPWGNFSPSNCLLSLSTLPQLQSWTAWNTSKSNTTELPWLWNTWESSANSITHSSYNFELNCRGFSSFKGTETREQQGLLCPLFSGLPVHTELFPWACGQKAFLSHTGGCFLHLVFTPADRKLSKRSSFYSWLSPHLTARSDGFYLGRNRRIGPWMVSEQSSNHSYTKLHYRTLPKGLAPCYMRHRHDVTPW